MKITDLMVGDWFKAVDYNSPFRITAIYDDVVQTQADYQSEIDGNWYSEAEIKDLVSIPLTEEILAKNGFEKNDRGDFVIDDTIVIAKENYCPKNYYACTWYQEDFDDEIYYIGICELTFVHQLQHLLRLAGIEKEIEL